MPKPGAKALKKDYLLAHIGKIVTSAQLRDAAGDRVEWARRVRELREDEGWPILTHNDRADLKPGLWVGFASLAPCGILLATMRHSPFTEGGDMGEKLVDAATAAQELGMSKSSLYRLARAGKIPSYAVGPKFGGVRFSIPELKNALLRQPTIAEKAAG